MEEWNIDENKIKYLAQNLSSRLNNSLLCLIHSGISIYDSYLIQDHYTKIENLSREKPIFHKNKSALDVLLYRSKDKKLNKSLKSPSEKNLDIKSLKQEPSKKRKNSHQAWTNKQLIKVYGMRYAKSVRSLNSFTRSSRKQLNSITPKNLKGT